MKVLLTSVLVIHVVLCEVPPPYPSRGFRPSPPLLLPLRQLQTTYGVPSNFQSGASSNFQSGPPSNFQSGAPSNFQSAVPQTAYGPPNRISRPSASFLIQPKIVTSGTWTQNTNSPQFSQTRPQSTYGAPLQSSFASSPQQNYGAPNRPSSNSPSSFGTINREPQVIYGTPNRETTNPFSTSNNAPQTTYGTPINSNGPQTQYGVPNIRDIETLERLRQLQAQYLAQLNNRNPSTQYLPIKEPQSFRDNNNNYPSKFNGNLESSVTPQQQYLPVREAANFNQAFKSSHNANNRDYLGNLQNQRPLSQQYLPVREPSNFNQNFGQSQNFNQGNRPSSYNPPNQPAQNAGNGFGESNNRAPNQQYLPPRNAGDSGQDLDLPQNGIPNINNLESNDNTRTGVQSVPSSNYVPSQQNRPNTVTTSPNTTPNSLYVPSEANFPNSATTSPRFNTNNGFSQGEVDIQEVNVRKIYPTVGTDSVQAENENDGYQAVSPSIQNNQPVSDRYLPPSTTPKSVLAKPTIPSSSPTEASSSNDDERATEPEEKPEGPNVAIATAVAGAPQEQQFYLVQPDGRLQRVVYQRTQQPGDQEQEYTANYFFQNIQADPNAVYAPLLNIGK